MFLSCQTALFVIFVNCVLKPCRKGLPHDVVAEHSAPAAAAAPAAPAEKLPSGREFLQGFEALNRAAREYRSG